MKALLGAIAAQVKPADGDGREPLGAAEKRLQHSCEDLAAFLNRESQSKDSLLDANVKAIGAAIGCP